MTKPTPENVPKALDAIADVVLAYKPKPKTKPAKKRKRHAAKILKNDKSTTGSAHSEIIAPVGVSIYILYPLRRHDLKRSAPIEAAIASG